MNNLVHKYLTENTDKFGEQILIKEREKSYKYNEINTFSNQFANYLVSFGIRKGDRICMVMESTVDALIAILGILKIGVVFVPIFTKASISKILEIYQFTDAKLLLVDDLYCAPEFCEFGKLVIVRGNNTDKSHNNFNRYLEYAKEITYQPNIISRDLVYIMFTSGTTGTPKGVMITHESICTFMDYVVKEFHHDQTTCTLAKSPLSFDPYFTEIVTSFIGGGRIVLYPSIVSIRHFLKTIQNEKITNFGCGPSLLLLLIKEKELLSRYDLSSLKEIYFGYENCPIWVIRELQKELPCVKFINGYGTTETYASSTFHIVENLVDKKMVDLPIGKAIEGTELLITDNQGNLTKNGEIGELLIRGTSLMNGYWKNNTETGKVLKENPFFPESRDLVYYTGDLVRRNEDRTITFISRKDEQVKINGYRVEPAEVQKFIEDFSDIQECAIIAVEQDDFKKLVCYYCPKDIQSFDLPAFKQRCAQGLEPYKIPQEYIQIEQLPRNKNSKIDKRWLSRLYVEQTNR